MQLQVAKAPWQSDPKKCPMILQPTRLKEGERINNPNRE